MDDMADVVFYILIPVYQVENYLRDCIESVMNQTYKRYHIVLVDDGSTDKSGEICDGYKEYDNIHVVHQKNSGQLASRLTAVNVAKRLHKYVNQQGYIVFLDADDMLSGNALETVAGLIQDYKSDCVVIDWLRFSNIEDIVSSLPPTVNKPVLLTSKRDIFMRMLTDNSLNSMCRKIINISKFSDREYENLYQLRNGEDLIQSLDIYINLDSLTMSNARVYYYRQNNSSVTHRKPTFENSSDFTVREIVLEFLKSHNIFSKQDYYEYFKYCRDCLLGEIIIFTNANMPIEVTKKLIEKIKTSSYYETVTCNGGCLVCTSIKKTVVFKLLLNRITSTACIFLIKVKSVIFGKGRKYE